MAEPFLGEIKLVSFNFAPKGWALCAGQLLSINQNQALFSLLGTQYGGDGISTFALPNLQDRVILASGQGNGLSTYYQGQVGGIAAETLTLPEMPSHTHGLNTVPNLGTSPRSNSELVAVSPLALGFAFSTSKDGSVMPPGTISTVNGSQPHNNMMPYLTLIYVIALQGIFPSRN